MHSLKIGDDVRLKPLGNSPKRESIIFTVVDFDTTHATIARYSEDGVFVEVKTSVSRLRVVATYDY